MARSTVVGCRLIPGYLTSTHGSGTIVGGRLGGEEPERVTGVETSVSDYWTCGLEHQPASSSLGEPGHVLAHTYCATCVTRNRLRDTLGS